MRQIVPTTQFKRDARLAERRGLALDALREVIRQIAEGETLPPKYRDHKLTGPLRDCRECHIHPDWLLVYRLTESEMVLVRTGTHADLFGK
ncbi:MAG: type II toxin-antitoxin system YafQ family toxin [Gemmatimonadetes bacterium]|jgi:mRNA interferase YafQ|nr:type II toxin-antitoxin system YafQ family toxin [Gemmatimonadota bacterium]